MGSFLSLDNKKYNKYDPDVPKGGEVYTLTPPTTITDDKSLNLYNIPSKINNELDNLSKDINNGLTNSYNTITTTTDDIFMSINKGLKNLLDLSADSIDYFADNIGLYKNDYIKSLNSTTISSSDINNLSETTKEKLLNETTSFNETTNLNELSSDNNKSISPNISTTEIINNLSDTTKEQLLNETTSLNENMLSSEDKIFTNENENNIFSSEDNLDLSKINDYIISPTSNIEEKNNNDEEKIEKQLSSINEEKNNDEEKIEKQLSSINEVKNKQPLSSSYNYTSTDKLTTLNMADNSRNLSRF